MSISVLNTDAGLSGKTILNAEDAQTISGVKTFGANILFTDATYDIGASGATRPRDLFLSRNATVGGTITVTGGQIVFPASQAASSNANTLDDYEEGTFTPVLTSTGGGTPTYTLQSGHYVKIGQLVIVSLRVTLNTKGTLAAGTVGIEAFPFTAVNGNAMAGLHVAYFLNMITSASWLSLVFTPNTTGALIYFSPAAGTTSTGAVQVSDINTGFDVVVSGCYRASE